jgi:hypothetical protein
MALIQPDFGDPGDDRAASPEHVGAPEIEHRLIRDGRQVVARGALVCSECDLPLPGRPAVAAQAFVHCGWCGHSARARELFRTGVDDTPGNAVALVARLS